MTFFRQYSQDATSRINRMENLRATPLGASAGPLPLMESRISIDMRYREVIYSM
jgi:hypothetical protein